MIRRCVLALFAGLLASAAAAQAEFDFALDQASSNFTWSGVVNVSGTNYNVVGNPSNAFQLAGDQHATLAPGATQSIASGALSGAGDMLVTPDLHGRIGPQALPLYTIDCLSVHMVASTTSFTVASNGAFSTTVTLTILSGTMIITPLIGPPSGLDLAGFVSNPSAQSGTLTQSGTSLHLVLPVSTSFDFNFPPNTGTIYMTGTMVADWTCPAPASYCTAKVNSLGCLPAISASGRASYSSNAPFLVSASNILNNRNGLLFYGYAASAVPFQGGTKCVAPPTLRTAIQGSGGSATGNDCSGTFAYDFEPLIHSHADPQLVPGREVFCQYWSRDQQSVAHTNLTDAERFVVAP